MSSLTEPPLPPSQGPTNSAAPGPGVSPAAIAAALEPRRVGQLLLIDSVASVLVWIGFALVILQGWAGNELAPTLWLTIVTAALALVVVTDYFTRAAWQQLPMITLMVAQDPRAAEERLGALLRRAPMRRSIRVLLCHRLALLRYRQRRFAEVAGVCQAVLARPLGQARQIRSDLLLMLVDAQLQRGDLAGAYAGLASLNAVELNFPEELQREAMETRYAVASGHDDAALHDIQKKVAHAELLPVTQAAAIHLVLAVAARRRGKAALADWLEARGQLLGGPMREPGLGVIEGPRLAPALAPAH